jgi:hypothetical protein
MTMMTQQSTGSDDDTEINRLRLHKNQPAQSRKKKEHNNQPHFSMNMLL